MSMPSSKRVFISGVSGHFARGLLPLLVRDPSVEKIIGIDVKPPPDAPPGKLEFHQMDSRDPAAGKLMDGCQTFIHLAFILLRRPGQSDMDEVNIGGSRMLLDAAASNGTRKIIFTSSVVGYGLHPDNPFPLTEDHPLRPNIDLYYSKAKAMVEQHLSELEIRNPKLVVTRLRPCTVGGPKTEKGRMESLISRTGVLIHGFNPPIQLLHEEDLTHALYLAVAKDLRGIYNVTSDEPRTLQELYAISKARVMHLSLPVARFLMGFAWAAGRSLFSSDWIDLSRFSVVASNQKLKKMGWRPKYTTQQTFIEVLRHHGVTV
jgi:UDP-glucose 4-epimerase